MSTQAGARRQRQVHGTDGPRVCPQTSLFDVATYRDGTYPGAQNSPTSRAAARSIAAEVGARQLEVLNALHRLGTATGDEVAALIGRHAYVTRPRLTDLAKRGLVTVTGEERPTPAGRKANVWRLTGRGEELHRNVA